MITPEHNVSPPVITVEDEELDTSSTESSDDDEIYDPRAEPWKYFEKLGESIKEYTSSATNLALHIVHGRQIFKGHGSRFSGCVVLVEFNRRMATFQEFIDGLKEGHLIKI